MGRQMPPLDNRMPAYYNPLGFSCYFSFRIFVAMERSPELSVELNLNLRDMLEKPIISCTHIVQLIVIT